MTCLPKGGVMRPIVAVVGILCCLTLLSSCSSEDSPTESPKTTSFPLQDKGLAVGGDVQSRATDVFTVQLTAQQAKELGEACGKTPDFADASTCADALRRAVHMNTGSTRPDLCDRGICLHFKQYGRTDVPVLGDGGYVELEDNSDGETLCDANPAHLCLRLGIKSSTVLKQLAEASGVSPSIETPSQTETPSFTEPPSPTESTPDESTPEQSTPEESSSDSPTESATTP